jgi:D-alanyl-D-alanine carboxypeptidase
MVPRLRRPTGLIVMMLALVLAGCGSSSPNESATSTSSTTGSTSTDTSAVVTGGSLDQVVGGFIGDSSGGVEVLFRRGGEAHHVASGAAANDGEALVPGRPFRVGSVSKPFVATMVLQLADEGQLDLDAPLGDYLPDTPVGAESTVRQLLSHQSGIPNYTEQPDFFSDVFANPSDRFDPPQILAYVEGVSPGTVGDFAYSNTNYILLGQLIEHLDDTDLNTSLHQRITEPLGLEGTRFDVGDGHEIPDLVSGWSGGVFEGDPSQDYTALASSAWAAGSLISTADDLARFLEALSAGRLTSTASLEEMLDTDATGYGLGISAVSFSPTQPGYGHGGSIPGFSSTMAIDPATGDLLVILTNNDALIADQLAPQVLAME